MPATATSRRPRQSDPPVPSAPLIGVEQLAELLGVNHLTVRKLVYDGAVPFYRVGHQYRFDVARVLAALEVR